MTRAIIWSTPSPREGLKAGWGATRGLVCLVVALNSLVSASSALSQEKPPELDLQKLEKLVIESAHATRISPLQWASCVPVLTSVDASNEEQEYLTQEQLQEHVQQRLLLNSVPGDCPPPHDSYLRTTVSLLVNDSRVAYKVLLDYFQPVMLKREAQEKLQYDETRKMRYLVWADATLPDRGSLSGEQRFNMSFDQRSTWSTSTFGYVGTRLDPTATVLDAVADLVDEFLLDRAAAQAAYERGRREILEAAVKMLKEGADN